MKNTDVVIVPMIENHVDEAVKIHLDSFPNFFSSFLGPKYISIAYSEMLKVPDHIALVAKGTDQRIVGFVIGMTDQTSFYAHMARKHWLKIALASIPAVLSRPQTLIRLFRSFLYPRKSREASAKALLLSMAVSPSASGFGIGQQLVQVFLSQMKENNVPAVCLTTDADNNERTNRFYQHSGFVLTRSYTTDEGRRINEYIFELTDDTN